MTKSQFMKKFHEAFGEYSFILFNRDSKYSVSSDMQIFKEINGRPVWVTRILRHISSDDKKYITMSEVYKCILISLEEFIIEYDKI